MLSNYKHLISKVKFICSNVFREGNRVADVLSKKGSVSSSSSSLGSSWWSSTQDFLKISIARDMDGVPRDRIKGPNTPPRTTPDAVEKDLNNVGAASSPPPPAAAPSPPISSTRIDAAQMLLDSQGSTDGNPPIGFTENNSLTYLATGNPCLDFFFHIVPDTPADDLTRRLELAWSFDPLTTLKLVCNLRGVRGTGKGDREGWYTCALWLHKHHPKTLASNLRAFANFGYFKDLVEVLYRIIEGSDARKIAREEGKIAREEWMRRKCDEMQWKWLVDKKRSLMTHKQDANITCQIASVDRHLANVERPVFVDKEKLRVLRRKKASFRAQKASDKYMIDSTYRNLLDHVADLFAEILKMDVQYLNAGEPNKISLAAKWCPSINRSHDKATLIVRSIASRVFPKEPEYAGVDEVKYVRKVTRRLRKEVYVPLRKALQLPEVYMCARQWALLPYNRVASVAMRKYKSLFMTHDQERFEGYLENVRSGKAKIAAGALLPHQIIASLEEQDGEEVAELQWARTVDDLSKKGKLRNCMAICDVSGSMYGTPIEVCVALGLLVSELSDDPWKGKLITFSANPQLHTIEGNSLKSKTDFIKDMEWGMNTDFQKVFDKILSVAVEEKLSEDQMIQRLFVFSDMEFDQASGTNQCSYYSDSYEKPKENDGWETDYQVIQRKYKEHGYNKVPEIVFWNLRDSPSTPVVANQPGVALLSGFSKNLLTLFLDGDGIVSPVDVMQLAISGEEYQKLVVVD